MNTWPGAFDPDTRYRVDALALMLKIPDGAINLIVTDPPLCHRL
jgi:DNA modification methylase